VFEAYVERVLCPTLVSGEIVVMDNLGAHKRPKIRELIEAVGCEVWYLPAYSPDLSPVNDEVVSREGGAKTPKEEAFSKLKAALKKAAARTKEALLDAIREALATITAEDADGYFAHGGYKVPGQY